MSPKIVTTAAKGNLLSCDRDMLVEFGGYVQLNKPWAYSLLLHLMKSVQTKVSTAPSKDFGNRCSRHSRDGGTSCRIGP